MPPAWNSTKSNTEISEHANFSKSHLYARNVRVSTKSNTEMSSYENFSKFQQFSYMYRTRNTVENLLNI